MPKRYIITGAPGTGKTTLINTLQKDGFVCYPEISRQIIISQQEKKGNKTPWGDLQGFVDLVFHQTVKGLQTTIEEHTFVDRGLPDCIAYLQSKSLPIPEYLTSFPYHSYYNTTVFLLPLWKDIYKNDAQRIQSYQEAVHIQSSLLKVYHDLGFSIKTIPKTTIRNRIDYIKSML